MPRSATKKGDKAVIRTAIVLSAAVSVVILASASVSLGADNQAIDVVPNPGAEKAASQADGRDLAQDSHTRMVQK